MTSGWAPFSFKLLKSTDVTLVLITVVCNKRDAFVYKTASVWTMLLWLKVLKVSEHRNRYEKKRQSITTAAAENSPM